MGSGKIVILGAGVTGLVLAGRLAQAHGDRVVVIEQEGLLGGLAATLSRQGFFYDLGSHRLHPDNLPRADRYIRGKLKIKLLRRPRRGALSFQGRFLDYPPRFGNFFRSLPFQEASAIFASYWRRRAASPGEPANYEELMIRTVGRRLYQLFYRDFAEKLWGLPADRIALDGIKRRRTFLDPNALWRMLSGAARHFYYPQAGIGEITAKLAQDALARGAVILKSSKVTGLQRIGNRITGVSFIGPGGRPDTFAAQQVFSTIAVDDLYALVYGRGGPAGSLQWRDLRIAYFHVDQGLKDRRETFYFPSLGLKIGRVSQMNRYSPFLNPDAGKVVLTVEVPLSEQDSLWRMPDDEFLRFCLDELNKVKIIQEPFSADPVFALSLKKAYPVYALGWREKFSAMYTELNRLENLYALGRKGLFLHCNIDQCMVQALSCADFILAGGRDKTVWDKQVADFLLFSARD